MHRVRSANGLTILAKQGGRAMGVLIIIAHISIHRDIGNIGILALFMKRPSDKAAVPSLASRCRYHVTAKPGQAGRVNHPNEQAGKAEDCRSIHDQDRALQRTSQA